MRKLYSWLKDQIWKEMLFKKFYNCLMKYMNFKIILNYFKQQMQILLNILNKMLIVHKEEKYIVNATRNLCKVNKIKENIVVSMIACFYV